MLFFFKQKPAYEMRISDWSSDVCSSDLLLAVVALPLRDRCQPNSSRVWQSITSASVAHPSRPAQMQHRSVDHRSLGAAATEGMAWIRGLKPMARFFTCQPLSWKMRCTVFLLKPSRYATVR